MKAEQQRLEYTQGNSNKHWTRTVINLDGDEISVVTWGKIGTAGQGQFKPSGASHKTMLEKKAKGYEQAYAELINLSNKQAAEIRVVKDRAVVLAALVRDFVKEARSATPEEADEVLILRDEALEFDPLVFLGQKATKAISTAAIDPDAALVEYAVVTAGLEQHREALSNAEASLRTLEMMLGLTD